MNDLVKTTSVHAELDRLLGQFMSQMMRYDTEIVLQFLKQADLTLPVLAVLVVVDRKGATSIGEVATSLNYSLANASLLVDKLVCQDYVSRVENASDRRHKLVQLTAKGQASLAELQVVRADLMAKQLRSLPPNRLIQTIELLRVITDELPLPTLEIVGAARE